MLHILGLKIQNLIHIARPDGSAGNLRFFITDHAFRPWMSPQAASATYALLYTLGRTAIFWALWKRRITITGLIDSCLLGFHGRFASLSAAAWAPMRRYLVHAWVQGKWGRSFPMEPLLINVSGAFLIGLLMMVLIHRMEDPFHWRLFLVVVHPRRIHDLFLVVLGSVYVDRRAA